MHAVRQKFGTNQTNSLQSEISPVISHYMVRCTFLIFQGDSGGPLMSKNGSDYHLVGVTSFGPPCVNESDEHPEVFAKVSGARNYSNWDLVNDFNPISAVVPWILDNVGVSLPFTTLRVNSTSLKIAPTLISGSLSTIITTAFKLKLYFYIFIS